MKIQVPQEVRLKITFCGDLCGKSCLLKARFREIIQGFPRKYFTCVMFDQILESDKNDNPIRCWVCKSIMQEIQTLPELNEE